MGDVDLTFRDVARVNRTRCYRWHPGYPGGQGDAWTGADWANAMQGEAGEAGNIVKKLRRLELGLPSAEQGDRPHNEILEELIPQLATEIGDTFLYLDLLAQFYGLDLAACVIDTFNRVSVRENFPERL